MWRDHEEAAGFKKPDIIEAVVFFSCIVPSEVLNKDGPWPSSVQVLEAHGRS